MKNKLMVFLLMICFVVPFPLCIRAYAQETSESSEFEYEVLEGYWVDKDNNWHDAAMITGYNGTENEIIIPKSIDGIMVMGIGETAFFENESIESVDFTKCNGCGELIIKKNAFFGCSNLTIIRFPGETFVRIGEKAFSNCKKLNNMLFSENTKRVSFEKEAFSDCSGLVNLEINTGDVSFGKDAFARCSSLKMIELPIVTMFDIYDVDNRSGEYSTGVFSDCYSLTDVTIRFCYIIPEKCFCNDRSLEHISLPWNLFSIRSKAFLGCDGIKDIILNRNVDSIASDAFASLDKDIPKEMIIKGVSETYAEEYAINHSISFESINIPISKLEIVSVSSSTKEYYGNPDSIRLFKGKGGDYCFSFEPWNTTDEIKVFSSDDGIVECSNFFSETLYYGSFSANGIGDAVVTFSAGSFEKTLPVSVCDPNDLLYLNENTVKGKTGDRISIKAVINSTYGSKTITWSSNDSSIAKVDDNGNVTLIGEGVAVITATLEDDNISAKCVVTCEAGDSTIPVTGISLVKQLSMIAGTTATLSPDIAPTDATNKKVIWTSTKPEVALVKDGVVSGLKAGETTVIAQTEDGGFIAFCTVSVTEAASEESELVFEYTLESDGTATITGCTGSKAEMIIPDTIDGYKVRKIADEAFLSDKAIESVSISNNVLCIGAESFAYCDNLSSVILPNSLQSLGSSAFKCTGIKKIRIPKSLETVEAEPSYHSVYGPFAGCELLETVTFEDGMTQVPNYLFSECSGLKSIVFPDGLLEIGAKAFSKCSSLTTISFPEGVTAIYQEAFAECENLETVTLPNSLSFFGPGTFDNDDRIKSVVIPKSVERIGGLIQSPLSNCDGLEQVTLETGRSYVPAGLFAKCSGLKKIEIPDGVEIIERSAFQDCINLTEVVFPESLTKIYDEAFSGCSALTDVIMYPALEVIADNAFSNPQKMIIHGYKGSYSEKYAEENSITFDAIAIPVQKLEVSVTSLDLRVGEKTRITVETFPKDATEEIQISSSSDSVLTVDSTGMVTAISVGDANIVVRAGKITKEISVTVKKTEPIKVTRLIANETELNLKPGDTASIVVEIEPQDADNKTLKYISTKPNVVFVDENGNLIAQKAGHAEIVIWATDGSAVQTSVEVSVVEIKDIVDLEITPPTTCTYTGKAQTPAVTIKDGSYTLQTGVDYTVAYKNNTNAGTASITINGIGKYTGTTTCTFLITGKKISNCTFTIPTAKAYTGSKVTPAVTVKDGTKTLKKGTDYTVTYSKNINVGKATIKITGKGNYTGTVTKTFNIKPKGTSVKKVTAGTKAFTVTWTPQKTKMKSTYITGYQIQYSTSSSFASGNKIVNVAKYSTASKTIKNLSKGKKYYVRIRTYKTVNGVKYFSTWSALKVVTTK